uniref:Secreted protein n=1 Tax=Panagrellus redivivus TaxID=6233 RepID=A0A7E4VAC2_PANRE
MINYGSSQQRSIPIMGAMLILLLSSIHVEGRPFELDMNPSGAIGFEPYKAEVDPAVIMLNHIWKSVQQIKRRHKEIEDDTGSAVAQQLEVLRRINRRQVMEQRLRAEAEAEEPVIERIFETIQDGDSVTIPPEPTATAPTVPKLIEKATEMPFMPVAVNLSENVFNELA